MSPRRLRSWPTAPTRGPSMRSRSGACCSRLQLLDLGELDELAAEETWRRGVPETTYVLPLPRPTRCRSMPEAELLAYVVACRPRCPEVNERSSSRRASVSRRTCGSTDFGPAVEYEGSQHQEDRGQYNADIDRYAAYRRQRRRVRARHEGAPPHTLGRPCGPTTPCWSSRRLRRTAARLRSGVGRPVHAPDRRRPGASPDRREVTQVLDRRSCLTDRPGGATLEHR